MTKPTYLFLQYFRVPAFILSDCWGLFWPTPEWAASQVWLLPAWGWWCDVLATIPLFLLVSGGVVDDSRCWSVGGCVSLPASNALFYEFGVLVVWAIPRWGMFWPEWFHGFLFDALPLSSRGFWVWNLFISGFWLCFCFCGCGFFQHLECFWVATCGGPYYVLSALDFWWLLLLFYLLSFLCLACALVFLPFQVPGGVCWMGLAFGAEVYAVGCCFDSGRCKDVLHQIMKLVFLGFC